MSQLGAKKQLETDELVSCLQDKIEDEQASTRLDGATATSRSIDKAIGIAMTLMKVTDAEAFAIGTISQNQNRKLRRARSAGQRSQSVGLGARNHHLLRRCLRSFEGLPQYKSVCTGAIPAPRSDLCGAPVDRVTRNREPYCLPVPFPPIERGGGNDL